MEEKNIFALRLFFQIKTKNSIKSRVIILKMPFLGFKLSNSRKYVGIEPVGNGIWSVYYRNIFLGFFDETNLRNKDQHARLETNLV